MAQVDKHFVSDIQGTALLIRCIDLGFSILIMQVLDDHIAQHRAFQMKTAALINSASLDAEAVPVVLLNYLRNWLLQHILKSDMAYKSYLA